MHAVLQQRRDHGDGHADHAEAVAPREVTGEDRPRSARMNRTAATR